ncbi:hypothetical protein DFH06DRAFT_1138582 [Mycena polygramma]|nr:hypothetical protein DFH06DRAFT_1138582 [Mycena polygramma]
MARTKVTAREATGGKNPQAQLQAKKVFAGKGPIPPHVRASAAAAVKIPPKSARKAPRTSQKKSTGAPAPRVLLGSGSASVQPTPAALNVPAFTTPGAPAPVVLSGNPANVTGIVSLSQALHTSGDEVCYDERQRKNKKGGAYKPQGIRGFPLETTPIPLLVQYLRMVVPHNFAYLRVDFDLLDGNDAHTSANQAVIEALTTGELRTIQKIFVVLVSHTTPDGDLHFAPENKASGLATDVIQALLPSSLCKALTWGQRSSKHNLIAFMTCGSMVTISASLSAVNKWLRQSTSFYALIAFEAQKFQPFEATHFLQAILLHFFVNGRSNFVLDCLAHGSGLGNHTGVVYLRGDGGCPRRYVWAHPVRAPFGVPIPVSYCGCGVPCGLKRVELSRKERREGGRSQDLRASRFCLECEFCGAFHEFTPDKEFEFTDKLDAGGIWAYEELKDI